MAELIYLRQSAERRTPSERSAWFQACADEARRKGCQWLRFSVLPDNDNLTLVEGWDERPASEGDQRWQLTQAPAHD